MKLCIESMEDGSFRVYEEGAESMGEQAEMAGSEAAQPIASLDEALAKAKQMLGGGQESMSPEKMFESGDAMQAGFRKGRGMPMGGM